MVGAPPGLKSRGGLVIVDGGPGSPPCWANAPLVPAIVAPAANVSAGRLIRPATMRLIRTGGA